MGVHDDLMADGIELQREVLCDECEVSIFEPGSDVPLFQFDAIVGAMRSQRDVISIGDFDETDRVRRLQVLLYHPDGPIELGLNLSLMLTKFGQIRWSIDDVVESNDRTTTLSLVRQSMIRKRRRGIET